MDAAVATPTTNRYAQCIEASKRVRWEIDKDVIRGRQFDYSRKFIPDKLGRIELFDFATAAEKRLLSQIEGRTYANLFGLIERSVGAKILEVTRGHALGDQTVFESLIRFTDEELKHQELFRRLEVMIAADMPRGYTFPAQPNDVANVVLSKCTWAVLALTCDLELLTLAHYRQSIDRDTGCSELWKDVFLFHMREEAQHAILDELEWQREDAKITPTQRDQGVTDLIELVLAVDGILQVQGAADAEYFLAINGRSLDKADAAKLRNGLVQAYRWQFIVCGVQNERFMQILAPMITPEQMNRVGAALAPIMGAA